MENYLKPTSNGRRIVFPKDFADIAAFTTTCDWCVYNRIFVSRTAEWGEMEEGVLDISTYYYEANPASVLLDNINAARQKPVTKVVKNALRSDVKRVAASAISGFGVGVAYSMTFWGSRKAGNAIYRAYR